MEQKQGKNAVILMVTLAVMALLIFWVFHGHTREILDNIRVLRVPDLLFLLGAGLLYHLFDAAACYVLVRGQLPTFSFGQAVEVTFLGIFGNVATLSAGSIPIQSYYLYRRGLMAGNGVGTLTLQYVFHKATVLLYTTVLLLLQGRWLRATSAGLGRYLLLGCLICALIILALILLCTWELVQTLAGWLIHRLPDTGKWPERKESWRKNIAALAQASRALFHDRPRLGKVLLLDGVKLFCLYSIPWCAFRMLNVTGLSLWRVQLLTGLMHVIAGAIPNVAGMGPTEFAFLLIFSLYVERDQASAAMILYRVATFFFPFLVSIPVFLAVQRRTLRDPKKGTG